MTQYCYLRLNLGIETTCCLLQRMAEMAGLENFTQFKKINK